MDPFPSSVARETLISWSSRQLGSLKESATKENRSMTHAVTVQTGLNRTFVY